MISEIGELFCSEHYIVLMLAVVFACILLGRNGLPGRVRKEGLWVTILACFLLAGQDLLEQYAQLDPGRRELRLIFSAAGYSLRPAAALGFLLVAWPARKKRWFLWIPVILNAAVYCSAFFCGLAFYFDEDYRFVRGPLGWVAFAVCFGYLVMILVMVHRRFRERRAGDLAVIYLCALGCVIATVLDVRIGGISAVAALLISCITFYLFLRAQGTDYDPLTRLWNRAIFYEDCRRLRSAITGVASIDMNGLKKTNDELGHEAGDRALKTIGHCLKNVCGRKIFAYRVGGDEFMMLFLRCTEEEMDGALSEFNQQIWKAGMSVAVGYAARADNQESLEGAIRLSDQRMLNDKRMYYQLHDRRTRR